MVESDEIPSPCTAAEGASEETEIGRTLGSVGGVVCASRERSNCGNVAEAGAKDKDIGVLASAAAVVALAKPCGGEETGAATGLVYTKCSSSLMSFSSLVSSSLDRGKCSTAGVVLSSGGSRG